LTFLPGDPLDRSVLDGLVREAARIARLSRSERLARALDLEAHERPGASAGQLRDPRDRSGADTLGPMRFRTIVQLEGKTATGFSVPPAIVEALGQGQRPPVRVTIGDHTYRSTIAPYRGVFMLPLSAENREAAGVAAGDEVDVDVELDREPREVTVPPDLAAALEGDAAARRFFDGLSYSNRRRFVLSIEGARTADTRRRRIDRTVDQLRDGRI